MSTLRDQILMWESELPPDETCAAGYPCLFDSEGYCQWCDDTRGDRDSSE